MLRPDDDTEALRRAIVEQISNIKNEDALTTWLKKSQIRYVSGLGEAPTVGWSVAFTQFPFSVELEGLTGSFTLLDVEEGVSSIGKAVPGTAGTLVQENDGSTFMLPYTIDPRDVIKHQKLITTEALGDTFHSIEDVISRSKELTLADALLTLLSTIESPVEAMRHLLGDFEQESPEDLFTKAVMISKMGGREVAPWTTELVNSYLAQVGDLSEDGWRRPLGRLIVSD